VFVSVREVNKIDWKEQVNHPLGELIITTLIDTNKDVFGRRQTERSKSDDGAMAK
jgi:hypothetical protein